MFFIYFLPVFCYFVCFSFVRFYFFIKTNERNEWVEIAAKNEKKVLQIASYP